MTSNNIILVGMMATGKSTVGAILAEELGYELVDLDHVIAESEDRSIPEIFAEHGEGYFRRLESQTLERMLQGEKQIISTGGGAVLAPGNAELMLKHGLVVALTATEEEIFARTSENHDRPLLAGNAKERIARIMEERRNAYRFAHCTVDTTGLTAVEVSQHILMHHRG
ncbi:shikimate kinase [Paenibacillus sp. GCM10012306]|uniref:shikimate kinase n=1 Tax=Paenibacillus sp. GCM10012306 TaxID=3317342 RepID=UPI00361FEB16